MHRVAGLIVLGLLLVAAPASAAEPGPGLLEALARVPDVPAVRDAALTYVDYRAAETARKGAARPASFVELRSLEAGDDPAARAWFAAMLGLRSGSGQLLRSMLRHGEEWPGLLGFDFLDVDREVAFGTPPGDGLVLLGDFDPQAVGAALEGRSWSGSPAAEHTLWCGQAGCEAGLELDLASRDPANPFGGDLGRPEPMAVSAGDILVSADLATVQGMLDTAAGDAPSLASDPVIRSIAAALPADTALIQLTIALAGWLLPDAATPPSGPLPTGPAPALAALPVFDLVAIADGATATEQVVSLVLPYPDEADAAVAADVLPRRFAAVPSLVDGRPVGEILAGRGVTSVTSRVQPASDGAVAAAVIELRAPLASDQPDPDSGRLDPSSRLYGAFADMLLRRDTLWLAPALPTSDG